MSEVEEKPQTSDIGQEKSEDKMEIEKEEKQKAEDIVGEMFSEKENKEEGAEKPESSDAKEEVKKDESSDKEKEGAAGSVEETEEKKEEDKPEGKDKKFSLPKIKAPKIINEIRSRSKSREKKKNKEKEEGETEGEKKEGDTEKDETEAVGGEDAEAAENEAEDKKDLVKEAKTKVKDALDNIHLPKMPKMHKPGFMKKKAKEDGEKTEEENKEEESKEEKTEENKDESKEGEGEEKKDGSEEEKKEGEKSEEKKNSIIDSLKNIKSQVFPKSKKGDESSEKPEEAEKLLEDKEKTEEKTDEEKTEPKEKEKGEGNSLLQRIRNVASGVPALFKKDSPKEVDVEAGEKEELLDNKDDKVDSKADDLKMEEIKLEEEKKEDDSDKKDDEKKDPEKGDVVEEKSQLDKLKRMACGPYQQVREMDRQRQYGLLGILGCTILLIIILSVAASLPAGWQNYHKLVDEGRYVETQTSCGAVRGLAEGEDRFLFRNIKYSVAVQRFSHSRLAASLAECGEELQLPGNDTVFCIRRTEEDGVVGDEDCLVLNIATSSVVYSNPGPVVVIVSDEMELEPSTELAAEHGVVMVSVQVRQGVLGYLSHSALSNTERPRTSGNYALGDLITALRWVQLNIRHFGGDPDLVTVLGHRQGASLATGLTGVLEAQDLYSRMWLSAGSGDLSTLTLEEAEAQYDPLVKSVCGSSASRDCLLEAGAEQLLNSVSDKAEPWSYDGLPDSRESQMAGYLVRDSRLIKDSLENIWSQHPVTRPVVFGVPAQAEANPTNYKLYNWDDKDEVDSEIEKILARFDLELSRNARNLYNQSSNWEKYITMVSDIRSVCPLDHFANNFKKRFSDSHVSFYINQEDFPTTPSTGSSADIAAIFGSWRSDTQKYGDKLQRKFFQFAKSYIQKLTPGVLIFDTVTRRFSDERCKFWLNETFIPKYGRKF